MSAQISILIVDDEIRVVRALGRLFKTKYNVYLVDSGQKALKVIKEKRIHIVVSDQRMPSMSGTELLSKIKLISPNTIRILLTGYSDLSAVMDSVNQGEIFRYITKPWDNQELLNTMQQASRIASRLFVNPLNQTTAPVTTQQKSNLLILDQDDSLMSVIQQVIPKKANCIATHDTQQALDLLNKQSFSLMIVHLKSNKNHAEYAFIKTLKLIKPMMLCIVIVDEADSTRIVKLINEGQIYRYLSKPLKLGMLKLSLLSAIKYHTKLLAHPEILGRHQIDDISSPEEREIAQSFSIWQKFKNLFK